MTFTSFRKQLRLGTVIRIENFRDPRLSRTVPIVRLQTNAIATPADRPDGKHIPQCWIYWPKAHETRMVDDTLHLLDYLEGTTWATITIVEL